MNKEIKFKDLSMMLRLSIIGGWLYMFAVTIIILYSFIIAFIGL